MTTQDQAFLLRTLHLANLASQTHFPNPIVGALIVHKGRIIGEGFHNVYGEAHAEVQAVSQVSNTALLAESSLYVSLEPCSYHGNTPACTDLILRYQIPRVVIGCLDPNPRVAGSGVARLRAAGVEVVVSENPEPFESALDWFFVNHRLGRAFVTLKWAESADGFIGGMDADGKPYPVALTQFETNIFTHRLRATHQAILVGRITAEVDVPRLTNRLSLGGSPVRLVWDRKRKLSDSHPLFNGIVSTHRITKYLKTDTDWEFPRKEGENLTDFLTWLYVEKKVASVLVEGGTRTIQRFLDEGVYDRIVNYRVSKRLGFGVIAPQDPAFVKGFMCSIFGKDVMYLFYSK